MTDRYLRLLGIETRPRGLDGLRTLVARHLAAVPFENISKLIRFDRHGGGVTPLCEYLDGIEFSDLGGTCYTINPFLVDLLRDLGYDAHLLGADMISPDVHTCIRVRIDSVDYHVDAGFAAPFREPLRIDRFPTELREGGNRYVFDMDPAFGGCRLRMFSGDEEAERYLTHDPPRSRDYFEPVVLRSYAPNAHFLNRLRLSRIFPGYSLDLVNRKLSRHEAGKTTVTYLGSLEELKDAVARHFRMPRCPVELAVAILERHTGVPLFASGASA